MKIWAAYRVFGVSATACALSACAAQSPASAPSIGQEQIAIYETVLDFWLERSQGHQLVNEQLSAPPTKEELDQCTKPFDVSASSSLIEQRTSLTGVQFKRHGVEIIAESRWKPADPGPAIASGKSVDAAVKEGFSKSLVSFSKVALSSDGNDAAVKIGVVCGSLCGSGSTLRLHKRAGGWTVVGRCGGSWMS